MVPQNHIPCCVHVYIYMCAKVYYYIYIYTHIYIYKCIKMYFSLSLSLSVCMCVPVGLNCTTDHACMYPGCQKHMFPPAFCKGCRRVVGEVPIAPKADARPAPTCMYLCASIYNASSHMSTYSYTQVRSCVFMCLHLALGS